MNEEEYDLFEMQERRRQKSEAYNKSRRVKNKGDTMNKRMIKLENELEERKQAILDKNANDIRIFGKPLGCSELHRRVFVTLGKIDKLEKRIEKEQKAKDEKLRNKWMRSRDRRTLNDIRHNMDEGNTSAERSGAWDNRFRGSGSSRREAKAHFKRGRQK